MLDPTHGHCVLLPWQSVGVAGIHQEPDDVILLLHECPLLVGHSARLTSPQKGPAVQPDVGCKPAGQPGALQLGGELPDHPQASHAGDQPHARGECSVHLGGFRVVYEWSGAMGYQLTAGSPAGVLGGMVLRLELGQLSLHCYDGLAVFLECCLVLFHVT